MLVKEIMSTCLKTVRPSDNVKEAAREMNESMIGCLIVISGTGKIEGIVTERDILTDVVAEGKDPCSVTVGEIMSKEIIVIDPDASLEDAADVMTAKKIKKLPVVQGGKLVGIVTATDLVAYEKDLIEKVATLLTVSPMKRIGG